MADAEMIEKGKELLAGVALGYAAGHGLKDETIIWEDHGFELLLKVVDETHTVRVVFSPDEVEFFAELEGDESMTKMKIRNAFASLSM